MPVLAPQPLGAGAVRTESARLEVLGARLRGADVWTGMARLAPLPLPKERTERPSSVAVRGRELAPMAELHESGGRSAMAEAKLSKEYADAATDTADAALFLRERGGGTGKWIDEMVSDSPSSESMLSTLSWFLRCPRVKGG